MVFNPSWIILSNYCSQPMLFKNLMHRLHTKSILWWSYFGILSIFQCRSSEDHMERSSLYHVGEGERRPAFFAYVQSLPDTLFGLVEIK